MRNSECSYHCKNGKIFNTVLKTWQPCPECTSVTKTLEASKHTQDPDATEYLDKLGIPLEYRDTEFNPDTFFEATTYTIFNKQTCEPVLEQLSAISVAIKSSKILCESCYIYTGVYSRTLDFVYSCLKDAIAYGLTAVPYVSLKDLGAIRARTSQMQKIYSNITWFDYTTADICFVAATSGSDGDDINILAELIQDRERRGLPTYVMGYWSQAALLANRSALRFLINEKSNRLGLLKPYEIVTNNRYNNGEGGLETLGLVSNLGTKPEKPMKSSLQLCGVSIEKLKES